MIRLDAIVTIDEIGVERYGANGEKERSWAIMTAREMRDGIGGSEPKTFSTTIDAEAYSDFMRARLERAYQNGGAYLISGSPKPSTQQPGDWRDGRASRIGLVLKSIEPLSYAAPEAAELGVGLPDERARQGGGEGGQSEPAPNLLGDGAQPVRDFENEDPRGEQRAVPAQRQGARPNAPQNAQRNEPPRGNEPPRPAQQRAPERGQWADGGGRSGYAEARGRSYGGEERAAARRQQGQWAESRDPRPPQGWAEHGRSQSQGRDGGQGGYGADAQMV